MQEGVGNATVHLCVLLQGAIMYMQERVDALHKDIATSHFKLMKVDVV